MVLEVVGTAEGVSGAFGAAKSLASGGVKALVKEGLTEGAEAGMERAGPKVGGGAAAEELDAASAAAAQRRGLMLSEVRVAAQSSDAATALEGQVAQRFKEKLVSFQRKVWVGGKQIGEIDVELDNVIIEVTKGEGGGKFGQAQKLLNNRSMNPSGKPVIVYGPDLKPGLVRQLRANGVKVAQTMQELDALVGK